MEGVYGEYAGKLQLVMEKLVRAVEAYDAEYQRRYGERAYEHLLCRIKSEQSMAEKCARNGWPAQPAYALREIRDAVGLRIVCNFVDDIYAIADYLRRIEGVRVAEEKDYIRNVKPNGYRSYHMVLCVETPFADVLGQCPGQYFAEVQLRTIAMDSWAALEHQVKYKKRLQGVNLELVTAELKRCADELASCDLSMQTIRNLIREQTEEKT